MALLAYLWLLLTSWSQLPLKCSLSSFPELRAPNSSQPEPFSVLLQLSLSHCLAWIESQNTLVLLFLLLRTFYAKKALITKTLLRLVSFALGVCFIQQNSTEQSALGIQSPYPFSLKFSVFVTSSMVRVPAWRAWEFILPCKAGMDNVVKMFCRLQSDKQQGARVSLSSR